jgi:choice-of-anchor C domain-containing protein
VYTSIDQRFDILYLDHLADGIAVVTEYLSQSGRVYDAIHLVTHGFSGGLLLGNVELNDGSLSTYAMQFDTWRSSLTQDADLLLYGCSIASGSAGMEFVESLASLLTVDIAASTDLTGASSAGGDWDLEYRVGSIESRIALNFDDLESYLHLLATGTASADTLIGSTATETHDGLAGNDVLVGGPNVVSDGQFLQAPDPGSYTTYGIGSTLGGWMVTAGTVDLAGTWYQSPPSGGRSVDLDGNDPGTISQTLSTTLGHTYQVRFLMSAAGIGAIGSTTKALEVSAAGTSAGISVTTASTHSTTNMDWQERFFTFTATSNSTTLQFRSLSASGNVGAVLADVIVANLTANSGNDTLNGGAGADTILGSGGNDSIDAGSENDWIRSSGGNDTIDGGTGTDVLVFGGSRSDYRVTVSGSTYTITDLRSGSPDGIETITNVETFRFLDQDYTTADVALNAPIIETFEDGSLTGWTGGAIVSSNADFGSFLTSATATYNIQDVYKTFSLSGNQTSATISFTFNQFDSWDGETFRVWLNDVLVSNNPFMCAWSAPQKLVHVI